MQAVYRGKHEWDAQVKSLSQAFRLDNIGALLSEEFMTDDKPRRGIRRISM